MSEPEYPFEFLEKTLGRKLTWLEKSKVMWLAASRQDATMLFLDSRAAQKARHSRRTMSP